MNATTATPENPAALKYQIKRQSGMKDSALNERDTNMRMLRLTWSLLAKKNPAEIDMCIWTWVKSYKPWVQCESSRIGIYTRIGNYTNKKGITSKVHYTIHDNYLDTVKKLGDKPVSYSGYFEVDDESFKINPLVFEGDANCALLIPKSDKPIDNIYPNDVYDEDEEVEEETPAPAPAPEPKKEEEKPKPKRKAPTFIPKASPVKK